MLVPLIAIQGSSVPAKPLAATTLLPGAATSGFSRPSLVGPWLLVDAIRRASASRFATLTTRCAHASVLTVERSTKELSEKNDGKTHASCSPSLPILRG